MVRVAKKEAIVTFFIRPTKDSKHHINTSYDNGHLLYHNEYSRKLIEKYVSSLEKVDHFTWEPINDKEEILHIYLK